MAGAEANNTEGDNAYGGPQFYERLWRTLIV